MTKNEITTIARRLFPLLPHPEHLSPTPFDPHLAVVGEKPKPWWTPGRMCPNHELLFTDICDVCQSPSWEIPHEIPPPDPMDWEVFGQLLMLAQSARGVVFGDLGGTKFVHISGCDPVTADDPREALLLAVARMKGVLDETK